MPTSVAAVTVALLAALSLTPLVRFLARRQGLLDQPNERKVHPVAVPRLGGIAIAVAFYLGLAAAFLTGWSTNGGLRDADQLVAILIGGALIVCIGIVDDLFGMRARVKLSAQVVIAIVVALVGLSVQTIDGPWGHATLGLWSVPITVTWYVVVMNAINLIDGLDGLASGVVLIAMGAFYLIAARTGVPFPLAAFLGAGAGAVLGFLPFNLFPASIIMGDTGSMLLGFVVAAAGVTVTQSGTPAAPPWVPVLALGLPLTDTAWAIVRRVLSGAPIFAPDKKHVHHRLLATGLSHRGAMFALWAIGAAFGLTAVLLSR
jgi:UDP-GlcNAc:undecaprenyl-phosphate/decaprenyl-phosphate GlcNAc-1-phosphate transferase